MKIYRVWSCSGRNSDYHESTYGYYLQKEKAKEVAEKAQKQLDVEKQKSKQCQDCPFEYGADKYSKRFNEIPACYSEKVLMVDGEVIDLSEDEDVVCTNWNVDFDILDTSDVQISEYEVVE